MKIEMHSDHGAKLTSPKSLFIGTSNVRGINEAFLSNAAQIIKGMCYTLNETMQYVDGSTDVPDAVILHTLTNDLKTMDPQTCVCFCWLVFSRSSNFSAIWRLSPLPVTGPQILAYARRSGPLITTTRLDYMPHFNNSSVHQCHDQTQV
jgi:hypothetical protein